MNQDEIKKEIEKLDSFRSDCEGKMVTLSAALDEFIIMVATLKAKLGEAEKPDLRPLDFGVDGFQRWIKIHGKIWWVHEGSQSLSSVFPDSHFVGQKQGNLQDIFDDLKALAEPLKEFKVTDKQNERTVRFHGSLGNLYIELTGKDGERVRNINIPLRESALNLRRLIQHAQLLEAH